MVGEETQCETAHTSHDFMKCAVPWGHIPQTHTHSFSTVVMASATEEYSLCMKLFNSVLKGDWRLKIAYLRKMSLTSRFESCSKIALLFD